MTDTTRGPECSAGVGPLVMALELGRWEWMIGFTTGPQAPVRRRKLAVASWRRLPEEIAAAKRRCRLAADAPVESCYEAGPDGFWVHRYLSELGVRNRVVESSSIEVNRRARRAKTDRLDVRKLGTMLGRVLQGERDVWHEVRVPSETDEAGRQPQRELRTLKRDRTRVVNRIGGLLVTQGIRVKVRADFGLRLAELRTWRGDPLPSALRDRLAREWEKVALLTRQIGTIEQGRRAQLRTATSAEDPSLRMVRQLLRLRGIGDQSAWPLVTELFGWRALRNRRQVGGLTGLTGTPYNSGTREREQGISRAGNAEIRALAIELAWCWLQYQPQSALAQWYQQRWANGGVGSRKRGIVAVARRLMVDLWRYVDAGVIPDGAQLKASASPVPRGT